MCRILLNFPDSTKLTKELHQARRSAVSPIPVSRQPSILSQTRLLSQDVKATIDKASFCYSALHSRLTADETGNQAVRADPVVLFMKGTPQVPQCGFSRAVVQLLDIHGVSGPQLLKTYNVLEDQELRDSIKEYSSWPTIPQLYVKGEFVGGCDILLGMHQSGELEQVHLSGLALLTQPQTDQFMQLFTKEGLAPKAEEPAPASTAQS